MMEILIVINKIWTINAFWNATFGVIEGIEKNHARFKTKFNLENFIVPLQVKSVTTETTTLIVQWILNKETGQIK